MLIKKQSPKINFSGAQVIKRVGHGENNYSFLENEKNLVTRKIGLCLCILNDCQNACVKCTVVIKQKYA